MNTITAHCLVKNEENFVWYAIKSVIDFVDKIIVFDTGSTDNTVEIVQGLVKEYPDKIIFAEKGECDKKRHTELRQEMVDRTTTDWFMILDGDEVWTKRGMEEAKKTIEENKEVECLVAPFYLCVGDVYHRYFKKGKFNILGEIGNLTVRFVRKINNVHWAGGYGYDSLFDGNENIFFTTKNSSFLENHFWHLTHLTRSSLQTDYSSGKSRGNKIIPTYFFVGIKIKESVPEVFIVRPSSVIKLSFVSSFGNFFVWIIRKLTKNFGN
jgi:glycosyltransferase involved in cell wall biosynthesis